MASGGIGGCDGPAIWIVASDDKAELSVRYKHQSIEIGHIPIEPKLLRVGNSFVSSWIPIDYCLPKVNQRVLVAVTRDWSVRGAGIDEHKETQEILFSSYKENGKWCGNPHDTVTHWMPLPIHPEEIGEQKQVS